jgi:hypothetical protein
MHDRADVIRIDLPPSFGEAAKLRARWTVRLDQPLVLISQVQRSGGHLLAWLFDGHPSCLAHPHELQWGRPKKYFWPSFDTPQLTADQAYELLDEGWQKDCAARGGFHRAAKAPGVVGLDKDDPLYPFVFDCALHRELFVRTFGQVRSRREVLNAYLTATFNAWLDCRALYEPKQWISAFVPRIPQTPESLDRFFADYPDGHLISVIRHPAAWFASAQGRKYSTESVWRESTQATLEAASKRPQQVTAVLFDDLVNRTQDVMTLLCARLSLDFDARMLTPTFNGMPVHSNSSHASTAGQVDKASADRYKSILDSRDVSRIERSLLPLYEEAVGRHRL